MFNRTHTPARPAVPPTQATSLAALFMGALMMAMELAYSLGENRDYWHKMVAGQRSE